MDRLSELNDELLSAYLDGELLAEERAAVEARLLRDPEAQELVRELQAARQAVRELPRIAAPPGLKDAILRAADERMNPGDNDGQDGPASPVSTGTGPIWTIGRSPRGWIWGALAVAACLMIIVMSGEEDGVRNVAQHAPDPEPRGQVQESIGRREVDDEAAQVEDKSAAVEGEQSGPRVQAQRSLDRSGVEFRLAEENEQEERQLGEESLKPARPEVERFAEPAPSDGAIRRDEDLARSGSSDSDFYDRQQLARRFYVPNEDEIPDEDATVVLDNLDLAFHPLAAADSSESPVYFVTVNVTAEALRSNAVSRHFGNNSIALAAPPVAEGEVPQTISLGVDAAAAGLQLAESGNVRGGAALQEQSAGDARVSAEVSPEAAEAEVQRFNRSDRSLYATAPPADDQAQVPEVIAVEAPAEQLTSLLADLSADQENIRALAVLKQMQDAAAQETWEVPENFNRNAAEAVSQVAGTWRFETPGPAAMASTSGNSPDSAAYGGYGGGYTNPENGGYGERNGNTPSDHGTPSTLRDASGYGAEPQPGSYRGGYGGSPESPAESSRFGDNMPTQAQAEAPSSELGRRSRRSEMRQQGAISEPSAAEGKEASVGQAWIINRQQVRNLPPEPSLQLQERPLDSYGLNVPSPAQPDESLAAEGLAMLPARKETQTAVQEELGVPEPELAAEPDGRDFLERNRERRSTYRSSPLPPAPGPAPASEPAPPESRPTSPPAGGSAQQPAQRQPSQAGEQLAQMNANASPRQVRMLLFLNVVPSPPAAAPQPSEAAKPAD